MAQIKNERRLEKKQDVSQQISVPNRRFSPIEKVLTLSDRRSLNNNSA